MDKFKRFTNESETLFIFGTKSRVHHLDEWRDDFSLPSPYNESIRKWIKPNSHNISEENCEFFMCEDLSSGVHIKKHDDVYTAVFMNEKDNVYYSKDYPLSEVDTLTRDIMAFIYAIHCIPENFDVAFPYRNIPTFGEWLLSFGGYKRPSLDGYVKYDENPSQLMLNYGSDLDVSKVTKSGVKIIWHPKGKTTGDIAKELCETVSLNKDFECCLLTGDGQLKKVGTLKVTDGKMTFNSNTAFHQVFSGRKYTSKEYEMTVESVKRVLDRAIQAAS